MTTPTLADRLAEVLPCFAAGDCYPDPSRPDRGVSIHDEDCPVSFRPAVLALVSEYGRERYREGCEATAALVHAVAANRAQKEKR